jgi:hypothetical protein
MSAEFTPGPDVARIVEMAGREGLFNAGKLALAASDALAPKSNPKRHPLHMIETGFVQAGLGGGGEDQVKIGYRAWYAVLQHENLAYHHPNGGEAKFLELGMLSTDEAGLELIADAIRGVL